MAVVEQSDFPERTDYTVTRGRITADPITAIEQRQQVDRETRRVAETPPPPASSRLSLVKRLSQALKGPGYKCRVCSEVGMELVEPWRHGVWTFRCRHCLSWYQEPKRERRASM